MRTLCCGGRLLPLHTPLVMGIVNATPDSFFAASRAAAETDLLTLARRHLADGAALLDIGGYSTRPGAAEIAEEEEKRRVLWAIHTILREFPDALLSVDTFRAPVAEAAVAAGAVLINDVSGGNLDDRMFATAARLRVPYVLTHMRGTPATMSQLTDYEDVVLEVFDDLNHKLYRLREMGVADVLLDPGFGFAKTTAQNFALLGRLRDFQVLNAPLLIGISRKGMIWKTLGIRPEEALNGTTVLNTIALLNGAALLRVHDVRQAVEAVHLLRNLQPPQAADASEK